MSNLIYKIKNLVNDNFYIGSTTSLFERVRIHLSSLEKNKHHSIVLQRAYNKYGKDNFVFEIIEQDINLDNLLAREQFYIDTLKPKYNTNKIAGKPPPTNTHSEESRQRAAEARYKPVIQYEMPSNMKKDGVSYKEEDLVFIKRWESGKQACEALGIGNNHMSECCRGKTKSAKGFVFKYEDNFIKYTSGYQYKNKYSSKEERYLNFLNAVSREYLIIKPDGTKIKIKGLKKFCEENNLNVTTMYNLVDSGKTSRKGFKVDRIK